MSIEQITEKQVAALSIGNVIRRYPYNGAPEITFDDKRTMYIETYEVRSVDGKNKMVELVMVTALQPFQELPGRVNRIFIAPADLVTQGLWWVDNGPG